MMRQAVLTILLIAVFLSCEGPLEGDLGLNEYEPELAVTGAITPGTNPQVRLTMSKPTLEGGEFLSVLTGLVELKSSDQTFELRHIGDGYYSSNEVILPENDYTIEVAVSGEPLLSAIAQVPSLVQVHSFNKIDTLFINDFGSVTSRLSFIIDDNLEEVNYYEFILYQIRDGAVDMLPIRTSNPSVENAGAGDILGTRSTDFIQKFLLTDRLFDGQSFQIELDFLTIDPDLPVIAHVKSLSFDYYRYIETVYDSSEGRDNPFTEPISVVGNVEGGQGIFGGYTLHEEVFEP